MSHDGCCNCFICKIGKSLGLMEDCCSTDKCCGGEKDCRKTAPKKLSKAKSARGGAVKKVTKKTKSKSNKK